MAIRIKQQAFTVEFGRLIRRVKDTRQWSLTEYEHTCKLKVYEEVLHRIDEADGEPFTMTSINDTKPRMPHSQVAVAMAFLRERGTIGPGPERTNVLVAGNAHLDGMIEWHAAADARKGGVK